MVDKTSVVGVAGRLVAPPSDSEESDSDEKVGRIGSGLRWVAPDAWEDDDEEAENRLRDQPGVATRSFDEAAETASLAALAVSRLGLSTARLQQARRALFGACLPQEIAPTEPREEPEAVEEEKEEKSDAVAVTATQDESPAATAPAPIVHAPFATAADLERASRIGSVPGWSAAGAFRCSGVCASAGRGLCIAYPTSSVGIHGERQQVGVAPLALTDDGTTEVRHHLLAAAGAALGNSALATPAARHRFFDQLARQYAARADAQGELLARLLDALYGGDSQHALIQRLSDWLIYHACPARQDAAALQSWIHEMHAAGGDQTDAAALDTAWLALSGGQVEAATTALLAAKDARLAAMVAQAMEPDDDTAADATAQLEQWRGDGFRDAELGERRVDLLRLLAGDIAAVAGKPLLSGAAGARATQLPRVSWIRALAMFLWYDRGEDTAAVDAEGASATAESGPRRPLRRALDAYDAAWQSPSPHRAAVPPPLPPYREQWWWWQRPREAAVAGDTAELCDGPWDALYVLLRAYCDHATERGAALLLTPECFGVRSADALDFRLLWLLHECFRDGHLHGGQPAPIAPSMLDAVYTGYAMQLEASGHPLLALYALARHSDATALHAQLLRSWPEVERTKSGDDWIWDAYASPEAFLREAVGVPESWVLEAKWLWARTRPHMAEATTTTSGGLRPLALERANLRLLCSIELAMALAEEATMAGVPPTRRLPEAYRTMRAAEAARAAHEQAVFVLAPRYLLSHALSEPPWFAAQRHHRGTLSAEWRLALRTLAEWQRDCDDDGRGTRISGVAPLAQWDCQGGLLLEVLRLRDALWQYHCGHQGDATAVEVEQEAPPAWNPFAHLTVAEVRQCLLSTPVAGGDALVDAAYVQRFAGRVIAFAHAASTFMRREALPHGMPPLATTESVDEEELLHTLLPTDQWLPLRMLVLHCGALAARLLRNATVRAAEEPHDESWRVAVSWPWLQQLPLLHRDLQLLQAERDGDKRLGVHACQRWLLREPLDALHF